MFYGSFVPINQLPKLDFHLTTKNLVLIVIGVIDTTVQFSENKV